MPQIARLQERLGTVFLPEAQEIVPTQEAAPLPAITETADEPRVPVPGPLPFPPLKLCVTKLKQGCYRLRFTPKGSPTAFRGTLRVENAGTNLRFSGDLYKYRPATSDDAADTVIPIPIYPRLDYHSYLKGTQARL